MALFKSGVEAAAGEVRKLREARSKLIEREQTARQEVDRLRADLPSLALADLLGEGPEGKELPGGNRFPGTTPAYSRLMALDLELRTCVDALPALMRKLEAAMRALNVARAADIRKRIPKLQSELAAHSGETQRLLSALQRHEDCQFAPATRLVMGDMAGMFPVPAATKTARLQQEIAKLEQEAIAIEQTPVNVGGSVDASNLEELLLALDQCPDDTIPPTRSEVEAWYTAAFARADAEWNGTGRRRGDPEPMASEFSGLEKYRSLLVSLVWGKDGFIDGDHSTVRYANRFEVPRELAMELGAEYPSVAAD